MTDLELMLTKANHTEAEKYPELVSKYIRERYTLDAEFALINNYNADPQGHAEDYAEYQNYRAECKAMAKAKLGIE